MPGPLLCPGDGQEEADVLGSFCRRWDSNRLPDDRLVQETPPVRAPDWFALHVQGQNLLRVCCRHSKHQGYCKVCLDDITSFTPNNETMKNAKTPNYFILNVAHSLDKVGGP